MSLSTDIRTALSGVAAAFADGTINYRTLTSSPTAIPRTFSAWNALSYSRLADEYERKFIDERGLHHRVRGGMLRVPFQAGVSLSIQDQVQVEGQEYAVTEVLDSATAAVAQYRVEVSEPLMANPRKGAQL